MSSPIKINDRFSIQHDPRCWVLYEYRPGINPKTKEPTVTQHQTYWANLRQVAREIIHQSQDNCTSLKELIASNHRAIASVEEFLDKNLGGEYSPTVISAAEVPIRR